MPNACEPCCIAQRELPRWSHTQLCSDSGLPAESRDDMSCAFQKQHFKAFMSKSSFQKSLVTVRCRCGGSRGKQSRDAEACT